MFKNNVFYAYKILSQSVTKIIVLTIVEKRW